jgi:Arc/MetJ family transcription regulator
MLLTLDDALPKEPTMRTNLKLDEALVARACEVSDAKTKRGVIEEALRTLVAVKSRERAVADYRRRAAEVDRLMKDYSPGPTAAELVRADREREV